MRALGNVILMSSMLVCGKVFALGVDVGPVHVHTELPSVHVYKTGTTESLKLVIDSIVKDEDNKAVIKIHAHRKGDSDDKFQIRVSIADLDDDSRDLIKHKLEVDVVYKVRMEKLDEHWKLLSIRKNEDD
jgi:hypothetical protein